MRRIDRHADMYIGQLNMDRTNLTGSYRFFHRGTLTPFPPDLAFDSGGADTGEIPFGSGSLGTGSPVGWKWSSLMDTGVDIRFSLGREVFVGAVCLKLADRSAVGSVEVFSLVEDELSCVGRYDAQTGGLLSGELTIPIGVRAAVIVVRFQADLKDIVVEDLVLIGADSDEPDIYPTPADIRYYVGHYPLAALESIAALESSTDATFAASYLRERFAEYFGIDIPVIPSQKGSVSIGLDDSIPSEGYRVRVNSDGVELFASCRLGLLYAVESTLQLASNGALPYCEIDDEPRVPVRGFHFGLPPREELAFARRLIRYVLIPMRYNTLFIEFAGGMRFDRHPEISEAWERGNRAAKAGTQPAFPHGEMVAGGGLLEKEEVREFVEYSKSFGFEVIPEVQSFGHVQYITYAHPEIAEVAESVENSKKLDTRSADQPPSTYYHHSYCPLHDKSYELIYDIIDEIVEVVGPERYVHMGHDEIYQIGLCPRCRDQDHADLYALHVTRMHDYLAKKGLKMMIWCDMLHPTERRYKTHTAIERLPRDIVMLDFIWYFHFDLDMEDNILPFGYKVIMGNMYSSHYPRYEQRIAKEGIIGGQVSTWCRFDEHTLAKKGKIFDVMYSAEMLWSEEYDSRAREVYTAWIAKRMPRLRDEVRGIAKPIDHPVRSEAVALPITSAPRLPAAVAEALKHSANVLEDCTFDFTYAQRLSCAPVEIPVSASFQRLVFLHATENNAPRVAWKPLTEVGRYTVRYVDGSQVDIPIEYAGNICVYTRRYGDPLPQQYYRHQGYIATYWGDPLLQAKTSDGRDVTALGFEWVNPHPEREITSILCSGNDETDASILLLGISGINTL
ncbi:MAG: family 20 glycosylhydrolase [Limnochordia bacterium]